MSTGQGEIDPLQVVKTLLPAPDESYYIGLSVLCVIVPITVSMYYVIQDVHSIVSKNPSYDVANFQFFVNNTYYLIVGAMVCSLVNLLYTLRKRPEKADVKNMGFWFTLATLMLFSLLGARLSLLISMISVTGSDSIINLQPSEVVYVRTKLKYLTFSIVVSFICAAFAFFLINGAQMIDIITNLKTMMNKVKEESSGGD